MPRLVPALELLFPPLSTHPDLPDRVAVALDGAGLAAVHEAGSDDEPLWRVFLTDPAGTSRVAAQLQDEFAADGCRVTLVEIEDEDWAARQPGQPDSRPRGATDRGPAVGHALETSGTTRA